jgi:hypothetical protein
MIDSGHVHREGESENGPDGIKNLLAPARFRRIRRSKSAKGKR